MEQVQALYVGNMLSPLVSGQNQLGAFFGDWIGPWHKEAVKLEAACGSGAAAFRAALMAVASGDVDSALALGVEKMTDKAGHDVTAALATAADADYEVEQGVSFVGLNALIMLRYMHEYGWKHGDFAPFSINAHANAVHNPFARLRDKISIEKFEKASMIATPINLLDASPIGDGAAAAILVPAEKVKSLPGRPRVVVAASAAATDTIAVHSRRDPLVLTAAQQSARRCYELAGVTPDDIDLFELHDAFSIMSALSLEASRLCRARPGCAPGPGRQDLDQGQHPDLHQRRAQGPRSPGRRHRHVPDRGSGSTIARRMRPHPGGRSACWHGPEHRGKRRFDPHAHSLCKLVVRAAASSCASEARSTRGCAAHLPATRVELSHARCTALDPDAVD